MSLSEYTEHRDHVATKSVDELLGHLAWYSVSETTVPHATLKATLATAGLEKMIYGPPSDSDVFRRTFFNGQRRKYETQVSGVFENLLIRQVSATAERIIKRIVVEEVDSNGETLSYDEAVEVRFNSNHPDDVDIKEIGTLYNGRASQLATDLRGDYRASRGCVNAQGIREVLRRSLDACMATSVREGGGVYFVTTTYAEQLEALEALARVIPGCSVHTLPLIDDRKQRDMVKAAFEAETTTDVDKILVEIGDLLAQEGGVSSRKFAGLQSKYAYLKRRSAEYEALLSEKVDSTEFRMSNLGIKMGQLLAKVE